jgi:DNA polymerase-3 subunit gamma/tau
LGSGLRNLLRCYPLEFENNEQQTGYTALYRRWRPQLFSEVVGQSHVTRTLQNALFQKRVAHAYLFCGLRGTGKTTMAKLLAKALNCLEGVNEEPCNSCRSCREVMEGRNMDVLEIDAASNRGIDEIRDLREKARYVAAQNRYKVYIVDEVHMLTNEAFNALLKTLEEPPPNVIFILATTEAHKLPLTVISRCQRFDFHLLEAGQIAERLREVAGDLNFSIEEETLYLLGRQADGSVRDALGFLEQCKAYGGEKISFTEALEIMGLASPEAIYGLLQAVLDENIADGLTAIREIVYKGRDLHRFLQELVLYLRKLLLLQAGGDQDKTLAEIPALRPYLLQHKGCFEQPVLLEMLEILQDLTFQLRGTSQPQFLLELTFLRLLRAYRFRHYLSSGELFNRLQELESRLQSFEQKERLETEQKQKVEFEKRQEQTQEPVTENQPGKQEHIPEHVQEDIKGSVAGKQEQGQNRERMQPQETTEVPDGAAPPPADDAASYQATGSLADKVAPRQVPGVVSSSSDKAISPSVDGVASRQVADVAPGAISATPEQKSGETETIKETVESAAKEGADDQRSDPLKLARFWEERLLPELKKQRKAPIHALLQVAEPVSCEAGVFTIALPFLQRVLKPRIESANNKKFIESLLEQLLNKKLVLKVILMEEDKEPDDEKRQKPDTVKNLSKQNAPEGKNVSRVKKEAKGNEKDFFFRQMLELFNGRLIETYGEPLDSRDFWTYKPTGKEDHDG